MKYKTKAYITCITLFLTLSFAITPLATAAEVGTLTLTPTTQTSGNSVSVAGTGFGDTKAVAIGLGAEVAASDINMAYTGTTNGLTWSGRVSNYPIKPGSFVLTSDTGSSGLLSTYIDNGDGTTTGSFEGAVGTINYVTGAWTRVTTVDVTGYATNYSATYTRYEYSVAPEAGVTTSASGAFTTSITVPAVPNGDYTVTSIDTKGNWGTATLTVGVVIPERLTVMAIVVLSSVAVIASSVFFRKQSRVKNLSYARL